MYVADIAPDKSLITTVNGTLTRRTVGCTLPRRPGKIYLPALASHFIYAREPYTQSTGALGQALLPHNVYMQRCTHGILFRTEKRPARKPNWAKELHMAPQR